VRITAILVIIFSIGINFVFADGVSIDKFVDSQHMTEQLEDVTIPEKKSPISIPTLNGTGYVFNIPTPMATIFLERECQKGKRVIDIGCGFSDIPIEAIKNGVSEYIANDISKDHLKILVKKAIDVFGKSNLTNLKVLHGQVPNVLGELQGKYDAIFADKVIHFFSPSEIRDFIHWAKNALNKNGRLYVTVSSVYGILGQHDDYKAKYLQNLENGEEFPGCFADVMSKLRESGKDLVTIIPECMVLFSKVDLENLFKSNGMKIIHSCSLKVLFEKEFGWGIVENENYENPGDFIEIIVEKY